MTATFIFLSAVSPSGSLFCVVLGLIPRCINGLLQLMKKHLKKHEEWSFQSSFSYLEIYQEKVGACLSE